MMYPFMELPDGTAVEHSQVVEEKGKKKIFVYFERETEKGYDSAKCEYPNFFWAYNDGFTNEEIDNFEALLRRCRDLLPLSGKEITPAGEE